jgi:hypothetical protein
MKNNSKRNQVLIPINGRLACNETLETNLFKQLDLTKDTLTFGACKLKKLETPQTTHACFVPHR